MRQVAGEVGVQGIDPTGGGQRQLAGVLRAEPGGADGKDVAGKAPAEVTLRPGGGAVGGGLGRPGEGGPGERDRRQPGDRRPFGGQPGPDSWPEGTPALDEDPGDDPRQQDRLSDEQHRRRGADRHARRNVAPHGEACPEQPGIKRRAPARPERLHVHGASGRR